MMNFLKKWLAKPILSLTLLSPVFTAAYAQSPASSIVGNELLTINNQETPIDLRRKLESHVQTLLTVSTPEGTKQFRVRPSSFIVSGDRDKAFFNGVGATDTADKLFIQLYPDCFMAQYVNKESHKSYTLAPERQVTEAAFWKSIETTYTSQKLARNSGMELENVKSRLFVRGNISGYIWVKDHEVAEYTQSTFPENPKASHAACHESTSPGQLKGTINGSNYISKTGSLMGYIGKRDLYVNLYNWNNELSSFEIGQMIPLLPNSLPEWVDGRFGNIRIVVMQNPLVISSADLPWNDNSQQFLTSFSDYVKSHVHTVTGTVTNPDLPAKMTSDNCYHMLLQRNHAWDNNSIFGLANTPGNYSMAFAAGTARFAAHEFGHNLGAFHVDGCSGWATHSDLMSTTGLCPALPFHTSASNRDRIDSRVTEVSILDEMPVSANEILQPIIDPYYTQELFQKTNSTRDASLNYSSTSGYSRVSRGALFDGQDIPSWSDSLGDRITVYKVKLPATTIYQFKIIAADYDTYLYLLDKNGNLIAKDNDGVAGTNRSYIAGYFANDWYYLIVGGFGHSSGWATLKIRNAWYQGGDWKGSPNGPDADTMRLDMGNGNIVYSADFGLNTKTTGGIAEVSVAPVDIYPNPASPGGNLVLRMDSAKPRKYALYNNMGALMQAGNLLNATETISLGALPAGHYYIRVIDEVNGMAVNKQFVIL